MTHVIKITFDAFITILTLYALNSLLSRMAFKKGIQTSQV